MFRLPETSTVTGTPTSRCTTWAIRASGACIEASIWSPYPYGVDVSDIPLVGDFDGDGTDDIVLYRKATGQCWGKASAATSSFTVVPCTAVRRGRSDGR